MISVSKGGCLFEYIVFKDVNDSLVYAKEIVKLLRGIDCRINLIRFHAIPNVNLEGTDMETMVAFRDYLTQHGVFCYYSCIKRGGYICGVRNVVDGQTTERKRCYTIDY